MPNEKSSATAFASILGANLLVILRAHSFLKSASVFWWMIFQSVFNFTLGTAMVDLPNRRTYALAYFLSAALVFLIGFGTCFMDLNKH